MEELSPLSLICSKFMKDPVSYSTCKNGFNEHFAFYDEEGSEWSPQLELVKELGGTRTPIQVGENSIERSSCSPHTHS